MNADDGALYKVSERIIGYAFKVSNTLGVGFLERVYENALAYELRATGLLISQQHAIAVKYDGVLVGDYVADILVEEMVLVELKTVSSITEIHVVQCMNYLKATGLPLCLLPNFGTKRMGIRRISNTR